MVILKTPYIRHLLQWFLNRRAVVSLTRRHALGLFRRRPHVVAGDDE